jgi:uncharacterized membrane protein YgcG
LDINKNTGKIQVATIDKKSVDNVVDFKLSNSKKGVSIAVAKGTFASAVSVCFQEYTGKNLDTYPQPFVDPFVVLPDEKLDAVSSSGGFFLDFADRDTNVPQGDSMKKPIAIEWNQPENDKNDPKSVNPYLWDDFTEEWIMPAETIKNSDLAFVRHGNTKVTFSVGYLACSGQFHMYAGARKPSSRRPSANSRTSGGGFRTSGGGSRTSGGGSRTSGSRKTPELLSGSGTFTVSLPPTPTPATSNATQSAVSTEAPSTLPPTPSSRTPSRRPSTSSTGTGTGSRRPSSRTARSNTPSASVSAASSLLVSSWVLAVVSFVSFFFFF